MPVYDDDPDNDGGTPGKRKPGQEHPNWMRNLALSVAIAAGLFAATLGARGCNMQSNPHQPVKYAT